MRAELDWHTARALLEWHIELGATEAIGDAPVDRFALAAIEAPAQAPAPVNNPPVAPEPGNGAPAGPAQPVSAASGPDPLAEATRLAQAAPDLVSLAEALAGFPHCELRKGARSCVFADGDARARVMIIGEAPGSEEDRRGLPFVGPAGQLLDAMFAEIGLRRDSPDPAAALYITNPVPWRPPGNRDPSAEELAMLRPFLFRHVELAAPDIIVLMGNTACQTVLQRRGIMRLRGQWQQALGRPVLPTLHPAGLLRTPENRRLVWADLLSLKSRLREMP